MRVGNGAKISVTAVETMRLLFENNKYLLLDNVYFILDFKRNLISVSRLHEQFISISFDINSISLSRNAINIVGRGFKKKDIFRTIWKTK